MSEKRTQERPEALETPLAEGRGDGRRGELAAQQVSELGTAFSRVTEDMAESRRAQFEAKFADSAQYTPMVHAQVDEFLNATAGPGAALRMAKTDVRKLFRLDDLVEADEESDGAEHVYVDYNELAADENLEQKERRLARFFRIQIVETMVALLGTHACISLW